MTLYEENQAIFEQIASEVSLLEGFIAVKRNKGAPGVDGKTIEEFECVLHAE